MSSHVIYPTYQFVTGITRANPSVVTTLDDHDFTPGEIVSFRVSVPYGMVEINNKEVKVISTTSNTLTIDLDTTSYSAFIYPVSGENTPPVIVPSASSVVPGFYTPAMNLADSFDNRRVN